MKNTHRIAQIMSLCLAGSFSVRAQTFQVPGGSTGADGPLNVTANTELPLPPDGVLNYTTINVAAGVTLTFQRNANNTPVYLLATEEVTIAGLIDVSGGPASNLAGGKGGPGGHDGGDPGPLGVSGGKGHGPGGGGPGTDAGNSDTSAGPGVHAVPGPFTASTNYGQVYGGPLLIPLAGEAGSGGGGAGNAGGGGGGGGGGAILVCSGKLIDLIAGGEIRSIGGQLPGVVGGSKNLGSGGAIRLVAPKIQGAGSVVVHGYGQFQPHSAGRIRIDTHDRTGFQGTLSGVVSHGSFVVARLANEPALHIVHLAGQDIPVGSGPVEILLPTDTPQSQPIQIRAENFNSSIDVEVVLKPINGPATSQIYTMSNSTGNPFFMMTNAITIPGNTHLRVEAFKR